MYELALSQISDRKVCTFLGLQKYAELHQHKYENKFHRNFIIYRLLQFLLQRSEITKQCHYDVSVVYKALFAIS